MPKSVLGQEQKRRDKEIALKQWIKKQMAENDLSRTDIADVLHVTPTRVSQLLRIPKKDEHVNTDVFSYGTILILCDLFKANEYEKQKLLTL